MKIKLFITVTLYLLLVQGGVSNAQESTHNTNLILEKVSKYSFSETVDILINEAKLRSWNIPVVHDLQKSLAKAGKNVNPVTVIEICKPEFSEQILKLNYERIISVLMPCRISVYEKIDGKTYISVINGGALSTNMPENIVAVMQSATDEILDIIKMITD